MRSPHDAASCRICAAYRAAWVKVPLSWQNTSVPHMPHDFRRNAACAAASLGKPSETFVCLTCTFVRQRAVERCGSPEIMRHMRHITVSADQNVLCPCGTACGTYAAPCGTEEMRERAVVTAEVEGTWLRDYCASCVADCDCGRLDTLTEPFEVHWPGPGNSLIGRYECSGGHKWTCNWSSELLHETMGG